MTACAITYRTSALITAAVLVTTAMAPGSATARDRGPAVAAAASLHHALPKIVDAYGSDRDRAPRVSFGSSGNLYRQIRQGAPFELFLSADDHYVQELVRHGYGLDQGAVYGIGRLALLVPNGAALLLDATLGDLAASLSSGRLGRFAIPNPEHAPYGRAAREVLRHHGLWQAIQPHLVVGENAAQATQFALSGSADGGIVPYSLAIESHVAARAGSVLLSDDWHARLIQRMVRLKGASGPATHFYRFLQGPAARDILRHHGLELR